MKTACLAILNYNGRRHLEHLLPTAIASAQKYPGRCTVLVLDNRSTDPDVEWIGREFPTVQVVVSPENDFLFSYNWLASIRNEDILVLLNNDLKLDPDFLLPLVHHLCAPDVFSVGACSFDWEGKEYTSGPAQIKSRKGFYYWPYEFGRQELCYTLFTSGGFMAVDRIKFLEIGGFNRLFYPAYHEDVELCFRAWRKGWRCIYEPASVVWHRENASWNNSPFSSTSRLSSQNSLLFQWACLPMNHEVWGRRWSMANIVVGGALHFDFSWAANFLVTSMRWHKLKHQLAGLKATEKELESIIKAIDCPVSLIQ